MQDYQLLYTLLFNACTDAVEAIDRMDFGAARTILISAQQRAEEAYLSAEEGSADDSPLFEVNV